MTLRYSLVLSATHAEARFFGYDVEYTTPRRSRGVGRPSSRTRPSYPRWCVEERGGLLLLRTQEPMMRESSALSDGMGGPSRGQMGNYQSGLRRRGLCSMFPADRDGNAAHRIEDGSLLAHAFRNALQWRGVGLPPGDGGSACG